MLKTTVGGDMLKTHCIMCEIMKKKTTNKTK